jgi:Protein of unknown function (DUF664)
MDPNLPVMVQNNLTGPPAAGNEIDTLLGGLERERRIFAWKCCGLDAAGLRAQHPPTTMTLGGLLKHMALVEYDTFAHKMFGEAPPPPWDAVD